MFCGSVIVTVPFFGCELIVIVPLVGILLSLSKTLTITCVFTSVSMSSSLSSVVAVE